MKCYYTYNDGNKILIPQCFGTIHTDDIDDCVCKIKTQYQFEKTKFNQILQQKDEIIKKQQDEINRLKNIIEER